ncbi:MAG: hypothetical protein ACKOA6_06365 [Actinomycetota bacterium]
MTHHFPTDPSSNDSERIDDLASRLLDDDIAESEVPAHLRTAVNFRREAFARQRRVLGDVDREVAQHAIDRAVAAHRAQRRRRSTGVLAAAAAVLTLTGVGFTRLASNEPNDLSAIESGAAVMIAPAETADSSTRDGADSSVDAATDAVASAEPYATADVIDIGSLEELETLSASWPMDEMAKQSAEQTSDAVCIEDEAQRLLTRRARYRGEPVEIYLADTGEISVYAQSDCSLVVRLGS